jgi:hypothetical protein
MRANWRGSTDLASKYERSDHRDPRAGDRPSSVDVAARSMDESLRSGFPVAGGKALWSR